MRHKAKESFKVDHVTQHVIWYSGENEHPGVAQLSAYEAPANRDHQLESWLRKEMDGRYSLQKNTKWIVFKYSLWNIMIISGGLEGLGGCCHCASHTVHGALLCYLKMNLDSCAAFWHVASISPSQLSQAEGSYTLHSSPSPTSSLDSPAELTNTSLQCGRGTGHADHQPRPPRCELTVYIVPLDFL